jgi:hypothetical protein
MQYPTTLTKEHAMLAFKPKTLFVVATLLCHATFTEAASGVDYSYALFKNIASTQPATPTVVNAVSITCPEAGNLISTASAQITMGTFNGQPGEADVQYGISANSLAAPIGNHHLLRQYSDSGTIFATAHYQRIDTCVAGQTVFLRFVVHRLGAETASAEKSTLVVTFQGGPRL